MRDTYWRDTCSRVIEFLTSIWGGKYSVLIPTDFLTIDSIYWEILEAFDPDYIYAYNKTGLDYKLADPKLFQGWVEEETKKLLQASGGDISANSVDEAIRSTQFGVCSLSSNLRAELKSRLAPFDRHHGILESRLSAHDEPTYPLTKVETVLSECSKPRNLVIAAPSSTPMLRLWVEAMLGATSPAQVERLGKSGLSIDTVQITNDDVYGLTAAQLPGRDRGSSPSYFSNCPFELGMVGLADYRPISERDWEQSVVLVIGEEFGDFALYFGLSRMRPGTIWLPPSWLDDFDNAQKMQLSGTFTPWRQCAFNFARAILNTLRSEPNRNIDFVSTSKATGEIEQIVDRLDTICQQFDGIAAQGITLRARGRARTNISDLLGTAHVVYNADNHLVPVNHDISDGGTMRNFPTPKPKGFTHIVPDQHRWVTEIWLDGVRYPRHPLLGDWLVRHGVLNSSTARSQKR